MIKRLLTMLCVVAVSIALLPTTSFAADDDLMTSASDKFPAEGTYPETDLYGSNIQVDLGNQTYIDGYQYSEDEKIYVNVYKKGADNPSQGLGDEDSVLFYNGTPLILEFLPPRTVFENIQSMTDAEGKDYKIRVTGPNIKQTLISGKHQETEPITLASYAWASADNGTLLPLASLNRRFGLDDGKGCLYSLGYMIPLSITDKYSREELQQYKSAKEFVQKTGYMNSNKKYINSTTNLDSVSNTNSKVKTYDDLIQHMQKRMDEEGAAGYIVEYRNCLQYFLKIYKDSPNVQTLKQEMDAGAFSFHKNEGNFTETSDAYIYRLACQDIQLEDWAIRNMEAWYRSKIYDELSVSTTDHYEITHAYLPEPYVSLYYDFTEKQIIDAWAAEMDTWLGRWQYFTTEGYSRTGTWGNLYRGQVGVYNYNVDDIYQYEITGPGTFTVTLTGENACSGSVSRTITVLNKGWEYKNGNWYLYDSAGKMVKGWCFYNWNWYFMDRQTGAMKTGWVKDGGNWYYMNSSGAMMTGWVASGNTWYYMNSSGAMVTGWLKINGTWYFFKSSGAMCANEWYGGYWFGSSGAWTYQPTGSWKQNSIGWWFGDTSGWYAKNETIKINDVWYSFNAAGYWIQ